MLKLPIITIQRGEVKENVIKVMKDSAAAFPHGEEAWKLLKPFVWEKSLQYAK